MSRFKYDAQVVQCALFPHLHQESIVNPPPAKRRKIAVTREGQADGNEIDSVEDPRRGIVLESSKETYLITWHEGKARYTFSMLEPRERGADMPSRKVSPSSKPPTEATLKTQDTPKTSICGPLEEQRTSADGLLPLSGAMSDSPEPRTSRTQDPKAKNNENDASKPSSIPCSLDGPVSRVLRSNLSPDDFSFENDMITIKGAQHRTDDGKMDVDGEGQGVAVKMLRWRWYFKS